MGGYQLLIAASRCGPGSARASRSRSRWCRAQVEEYTIDLHWGHHCFRKGHKIMVQVSSTWFPLIDRNPQKYVPNIFEAEGRRLSEGDPAGVPLAEVAVACRG